MGEHEHIGDIWNCPFDLESSADRAAGPRPLMRMPQVHATHSSSQVLNTAGYQTVADVNHTRLAPRKYSSGDPCVVGAPGVLAKVSKSMTSMSSPKSAGYALKSSSSTSRARGTSPPGKSLIPPRSPTKRMPEVSRSATISQMTSPVGVKRPERQASLAQGSVFNFYPRNSTAFT